MNDQFAQGDIFFKRVPVESIKNKRLRIGTSTNIIAFGEKTGHAHVIEGMGSLHEEHYSGKLYLRADDDLHIVHKDLGGGNPNDLCHPPLALEKGLYEVVKQREFDYEEEAKNQKAIRPARD